MTNVFRVHLLAIAALFAAPSAFAQSGTWLGNGLDWNNTAAWSGGIIATGSGNTANFTGVDLTSDVNMALGADRTIGNIIFTDAGSSSHDLTLTGNTLTLAGGTTRTINVTQADRNLMVSSVLAGSAGFSKAGQGTLTLTGSNSITGATSISGGGTLVLDYTTNDNRKLPNNSTLSLGGGTIVMEGGTTASENFTSTAFSGTAGTFIVRDGGTAKINLNGFTGVGASVVSLSHENMATTDRLNTTAGNLGSQFTVGNRWAANATNAADGDIVGYTGATTFSNTSNSSLDENFELQGGLTLTVGRLVNTLRIVSTGDDQVLNLGTNILQMSNSNGTNAPGGGGGGLLYAGGANGNYTINGTTGSLRIENQNGQSMLINVYSGTLTVNTTIGSGSSAFVKSGEGTLVLGGTQSNSGAFNVYQGVVRVRSNAALGASGSAAIVQSGAAIELDNAAAITSRPLTITGTGVSNGGALRNVAGNTSSYSPAITLGAGGARINSDAGGTLTLTGGIVTAGNNVTFGGAGNTTVSTVAISGTGGLIKDGTGITTLSAANTYNGTTTVNGGALVVNGSLAGGSAVSVGVNGTLGGTGTINGPVSISGAHTPGTSPGIQTFASDLTYSGGNSTVQWELVENTTTNPANPNADYDQIVVGGNLDFDGATSLALVFNGAGSNVLWADAFWDNAQQWTLYDVTGSTTDFGNLSLAAGSYLDSASNTLASARAGASFSISQSGNDVLISYVAVPEPTTIAILGAGAALLGRRVTRRRRSQRSVE